MCSFHCILSHFPRSEVVQVVYVTSVSYIYTAATGLISLTTADLWPVPSVTWYPPCGRKPFPRNTSKRLLSAWAHFEAHYFPSHYAVPMAGLCQWQAFWSGVMTSSLRAVRFLSGGPTCTRRLVCWCYGVSVTIWKPPFPPCKGAACPDLMLCAAGIPFLVVCFCNEQSSNSYSLYLRFDPTLPLQAGYPGQLGNHAFPLRCLLQLMSATAVGGVDVNNLMAQCFSFLLCFPFHSVLLASWLWVSDLVGFAFRWRNMMWKNKKMALSF